MLGNFLAARQAVLDVQPDGVFDVFNGLFVCVPLAVAALQHRARNEITIGVSFYHGGKCEVLHTVIIGSSQPSANQNPQSLDPTFSFSHYRRPAVRELRDPIRSRTGKSSDWALHREAVGYMLPATSNWRVSLTPGWVDC